MEYRIMKLRKEEAIQIASVDTAYEEIIDAESSAEAS